MIGGVVELASKEAVSLGMIIHELATNAAKYGALSVDKGRLTISWMSDGPNTTKLDWIEEQGPAVRIPEKGNFGTKLIMQLAAGLSAEVKINFLETGLNFSMTIPTEPKSIDYLCR